jgi:hypothetical protein
VPMSRPMPMSAFTPTSTSMSTCQRIRIRIRLRVAEVRNTNFEGLQFFLVCTSAEDCGSVEKQSWSNLSLKRCGLRTYRYLEMLTTAQSGIE